MNIGDIAQAVKSLRIKSNEGDFDYNIYKIDPHSTYGSMREQKTKKYTSEKRIRVSDYHYIDEDHKKIKGSTIVNNKNN